MMRKILSTAAAKADQAELFFEESSSLLARSSLDRIETCKSASERGFGLRVVRKGRIGYSFFSRPEDSARAIKEALKSAALSHSENYSLPGKACYQKRKVFDSRVAGMSEERLVDLLLAAVVASSEDAEPIKAEVEAEVSRVRILNTQGVDAESEDTLFSIYCVAKKKESMAYDYFESKKFFNRAEQVGSSAASWAAKGVGAKPLDYSGPVVLHPDVLASFFQTSVLRNLNGELERRHKTRWEGLLDQRVTGDYSIVDDPTMDWGVGTTIFDDEGVPTRKITMIKNGVLKNLYYDTRSANLVGVKSTGSGFRQSYAHLPEIASSNVVLKPKHTEKIEGLMVKDLIGFHNMNPVTGDFSLDVSLAFLDDRPVRGCVLTGNIFNALQNCVFDKKAETRSWLTSPKIMFDANVIAK